ncbi:SAM-dependent methyltransferase [Heliorestis acidaminivorans]|uniref:SAM-dependent methyltransferase n=1 Tax=Heliorestis acidaminivorans TaxID=553427 RepID=A0A6I0EWN2_9FIRM|nr:SAM-dependent methyltransferase [Heliorestis acidaminivorans]KAB2952557.1 SAM-dependent methyltransferase [Heliorestis acidaminivorans]
MDKLSHQCYDWAQNIAREATNQEMRHLELQQHLKNIITTEGSMTFRDFMELTLYHPDYGYYTAERSPLGPEGDFITSPEVSPLFGQLLARQIEEMWRHLDCPTPFSIIELGPGRGLMAHSILTALASTDLSNHLIYHLIEVSPQRRLEQKALLSELSTYSSYEDPAGMERGTYGWITAEQLPNKLQGLVLSNEFFDALPVHRLVYKDGKLQELYVALHDDNFAWQSGPISTTVVTDWADKHIWQRHITLEEGQIIEINPTMEDWVSFIDDHLQRGFVLTIDYGHPAEVLYHPSRFEGTLMTYYRHQANNDPFTHIGLKDLTTHIDFTALSTLGEERLWQTLGLTNQMWFLISLLDPEEIKPKATMTVADFRRQQQLKKLIQPLGMGETFRIMIQSKGLKALHLLGLREQSGKSRS